MRTITERASDAAEVVKADLTSFIHDFGALHYSDPDLGTLYVVRGGDFFWDELPEAGRRLQAKLLEAYGHFTQLLETLLVGQAADTLRETRRAHDVVERLITLHGPEVSTDRERPLAAALAAIDAQVALLGRLYAATEDPIVVPDTNALLYNPDLDAWEFDGLSKFTIVLTPPVLTELDRHKVNHRVAGVRQRAGKLVNQVKEYRRRGRLVDGVTIRADRSTLRTVATEPRMDESLPWLDPENADDRLLASFIEVMRAHPRSVALLITRDVNLQNKLEFAGLPFAEPPEPQPGGAHGLPRKRRP